MEANHILIPKPAAELSMDAAACIGCGACVAACKNASAMLFVSAKVSQFAYLPQGRPEANARVTKMVKMMDELGFGNCTNEYECEKVCPKEIKISNIARLNREYRASVKIDDLMNELRPVLTRWRDERFPLERLGDWVERVLWKEQPAPVA